MRPRASIQRAAPYVHQLSTVRTVLASTAPRARGSSGGVALTRRPSQAAVGRHASAPIVATATRAAAARRKIGRARLNSSHRCISYAVFCLKKKEKAHPDMLHL